MLPAYSRAILHTTLEEFEKCQDPGDGTSKIQDEIQRPLTGSKAERARRRWARFLKAEQRDGHLVLSDLRMGAEPDYLFHYVVTESDGHGSGDGYPSSGCKFLSHVGQKAVRNPLPAC
jgi:hypothetical protein